MRETIKEKESLQKYCWIVFMIITMFIVALVMYSCLMEYFGSCDEKCVPITRDIGDGNENGIFNR
jgi:hypothetical protein